MLGSILDEATAQSSVRDGDLAFAHFTDHHYLVHIFSNGLIKPASRSQAKAQCEGNAKIDGLVEDLGLTGNQFNIALTVFYILYVLIDVPSNWLLKIVGGGRYIPLLAMAFGLVGTCMGTVETFGGLVAARLILGACEGGLFGGLILYLSMFYKRHQLLFRLGELRDLFACAVA